MTHRELVEAAYKWCLNNTSCGVAFRELRTSNCACEEPDVIGFGGSGHSVLIECKASRSDYLSDKKKPARQFPELGMGTQRFYCTPHNLIKTSELPDGWGLVYVLSNGRARLEYSPYNGNIGERHNGFSKNIKAEHELLYSVARRLHLRGRIDEIYLPLAGNET